MNLYKDIKNIPDSNGTHGTKYLQYYYNNDRYYIGPMLFDISPFLMHLYFLVVRFNHEYIQ